MKSGRQSESNGRIRIDRYDHPDEVGYTGSIEGVRDDGTSWILWLDAAGSPECFWANREADGSVIGDPILLAPAQASAP